MIIGFHVWHGKNSGQTDLYLSERINIYPPIVKIYTKSGEFLELAIVYDLTVDTFNGKYVTVLRIKNLDIVEEICIGGYIE